MVVLPADPVMPAIVRSGSAPHHGRGQRGQGGRDVRDEQRGRADGRVARTATAPAATARGGVVVAVDVLAGQRREQAARPGRPRVDHHRAGDQRAGVGHGIKRSAGDLGDLRYGQRDHRSSGSTAAVGTGPVRVRRGHRGAAGHDPAAQRHRSSAPPQRAEGLAGDLAVIERDHRAADVLAASRGPCPRSAPRRPCRPPRWPPRSRPPRSGTHEHLGAVRRRARRRRRPASA